MGFPRKLHLLKLTTLITILLMSLLDVGYSAEETTIDTGEVLVFLKDVVQIDTSKYEVRLTTSATNYWSDFGGIAQTTGQYTLDSTGLVDSTGEVGTSILAVNFMFWDEELVMCSIYEESRGPALYSKQPVTNLSDAAEGFLQRYQTHTGDAQLAQFRNLLDAVDVTSNTTKTVDNLSLEVSVKDDITRFTWGNSLNGTNWSRLRLKFQDGQFARFYDDRSFYELGSSEVNISQEEAVSIALKSVENFVYTYRGEVITNLVVNEELIFDPRLDNPRLDFLNRTNRFVLYPVWIVILPLADLYPGFISYFQVLLWADSGEVISAEALGYGGSMSDDPNEPKPTPIASQEPVQFYAILGVAIVVAVIGSGLLLYLKKRKL